MIQLVKLIAIWLLLSLSSALNAETFTAHCRDYPPKLSFDGQKCVGILPDLVSDILSEMGHDISWIKAPWIRSIKDAKEGKVDLLIRHSMTPEREYFLQPIIYAHYVRTLSFYSSPSFESTIDSYEGLRKVVVGAIRGNFYSPTFSSLDTKELVLLGNTQQLIGMLELGRIDVAVTSPSHSVELFADRFKKIDFEDKFLNPMYISIPKKSKAMSIYEPLSQRILALRKSGQIGEYFEKYHLKVPKQVF